MTNRQCIYSWTPDDMNSLFFKNTNETNVNFQYVNNYKMLEVASMKNMGKDNGIKSLLLYLNKKLGFPPTYPLNLKPNNRYSLQITGYSQDSNNGYVYLWIRSKENNTCVDLSSGYNHITQCFTPVVTNFEFTTRLNNRVWFGIYFKNPNCGDKYYISQIQLFDLNLCGSPNVLVCNICGLTNCNCYTRPNTLPLSNNYYFSNPYPSQLCNICGLTNCNCYATNRVYGPRYYPTTNQFGPYRPEYNCNGRLLTTDCNVNTIETNSGTSTNSSSTTNSCTSCNHSNSCSSCNETNNNVLTNTTLCNYCGLNVLNCICATSSTTSTTTSSNSKVYPPGVTKECIYGFDILNTNDQLDNLDKYQQLIYVNFYPNYTINITTTPKSITGYIFLLGNIYLKWDYKNSISKGGFEFGNSTDIIKTDQIYDLNTEYIIEITNLNQNNSKTIKMTINSIEKVNETKNIDMEQSGYISFFSSCHNQLKDKYIGVIKKFYLYHII